MMSLGKGLSASSVPLTMILTLPCSTEKRIDLQLGLPVELKGLELVKKLKDKLNEPLELIPPLEIKEGPIMQNVLREDDVDLHLLWLRLKGMPFVILCRNNG